MIRVLIRCELIAYRCLVKLKLLINYFFQAGEELCIDYVPKRDAAAMRKELVCYCGNPKVGEANATCRVSFIFIPTFLAHFV